MNRVTSQKPCPVCGKPDWCFVTDDGTKCICMRIQSEHPAANGGWTHILKETELNRFPPLRPSPVPKKPMVDPAEYMKRIRANRGWSHAVAIVLGERLGVSPESLEALEPSADYVEKAFAFPMRDGDGKVIGIRFRAMDGQKWTLRGTSSGLFYPASMTRCGRLCICEGPTDTAAAMTLGLMAAGRASCSDGGEMLNRLIERTGAFEAVIISDNDGEKLDTFGNRIEPGLSGALRLSEQLVVRSKIVIPPAKDIRAWVVSNGTRQMFDVLVGNAKWIPSKHPLMGRRPPTAKDIPVPEKAQLDESMQVITDDTDIETAAFMMENGRGYVVEHTRRPPEEKNEGILHVPGEDEKKRIRNLWRKAKDEAQTRQRKFIITGKPDLNAEERKILDYAVKIFGAEVVERADGIDGRDLDAMCERKCVETVKQRKVRLAI